MLPEGFGWQLPKSPMWAFFVVRLDPGLGNLPGLFQVIKQIGIEYFMPIGSVEAFNESILLGFPRLNVFEFYTLGFTPFREDGGSKLRPVIQANSLRQTMDLFKLLKHPYDPGCRQAEVNLDG